MTVLLEPGARDITLTMFVPTDVSLTFVHVSQIWYSLNGT